MWEVSRFQIDRSVVGLLLQSRFPQLALVLSKDLLFLHVHPCSCAQNCHNVDGEMHNTFVRMWSPQRNPIGCCLYGHLYLRMQARVVVAHNVLLPWVKKMSIAISRQIWAHGRLPDKSCFLIMIPDAWIVMLMWTSLITSPCTKFYNFLRRATTVHDSID